jgi:GntR family colanic acid and biofilm gene transcriptional regulator
MPTSTPQPPLFFPPGLASESRNLEPVGRDTLQSQIVAQLQERLITGKFKPGEKLTLRALAKSLGTSLMPVRDALQHLQSIGALDVQPNRTVIVPIMNADEILELSDIRCALEGIAAERVARTIDSAGIQLLWEKYARMESLREHYGQVPYLHAHWDLHMTIAQLSQAHMLVTMLKSIWLRIGPIVRPSPEKYHNVERSLTDHRAIVQAIVSHDTESAQRAIVSDIREFFAAILPLYEAEPHQ